MQASHAHTLGSPGYNGLPFGPVLLKKGTPLHLHLQPSITPCLLRDKIWNRVWSSDYSSTQGTPRLGFSLVPSPEWSMQISILRTVRTSKSIYRWVSFQHHPVSFQYQLVSFQYHSVSFQYHSVSIQYHSVSFENLHVYKTLMFFTDISCRMASVISSMGLDLIWRSPRSS